MKLIPADRFEVPAPIVTSCLSLLRERKTSALDNIPYASIRATLESQVRNFLQSSGALTSVDDEQKGIACLSYIVPNTVDPQTRILLHAALFALSNAALFEGVRQRGVPFDLFKSTVENSGLMKNAGVKFYSPDQKLGYHNDAYFDGERFFIPKYVSIVNLFIGYDRPGKFYYINNRIWSKFEELFSRGEGKLFSFRPTPSLHESELKNFENVPNRQSSQGWTSIQAFWQNQQGQKFAFCNGELTSTEPNLSDIVEDLKGSLISNEQKFFIPQEVGTVMVFRNDFGFHSRDIFEDQRVFKGTTRLFLRSVSKEHQFIPLNND